MTILDYIFLFLWALLGVGFHVMQKIANIRTKYMAEPPKIVFKVFFSEDWNTLIVSILSIIAAFSIFQVMLREFAENKATLAILFVIKWKYPAFIVIGYAGQRLAYKGLGTAESVLSKRIEKAGGELGNPNPENK